ncbi:MAG: hypothetical protein KDB22_20290 [Planctomycetales bacterium]|nr:hypothetical protein [Planctomycetales bacterium]
MSRANDGLTLNRRSGTVYLAVLMASLLVAGLAMAALSSAEYFARDLNAESDFRQAQIAADAALEWAIAAINASPNWRTAHTHNVDTTPQSLGQAQICYRLIDLTDYNLADDPLDGCDVLVTATVGSTSFCWRASLEPNGGAIDSLSYAVSTRGNIEAGANAMWCTDGLVGSNAGVNIDADASLSANCAAVGSMAGDIYGTTTTLSQPLEIPAATAIDSYLNRATFIDRGDIPSLLGLRYIDKQLLSPNQNTINGVLNPYGIYAIDCQGASITISKSRLQCTLILINPGSLSAVIDSVYWEAARSNYPALLVSGNIKLGLSDAPLSESTISENLNPPGMPFRGFPDATTTTVYPSQIRGLIYASGNIEVGGSTKANHISGAVIVGGELTGAGDLYVHYRSVFSLEPPPGFRNFDAVHILPGSVRRVPLPTF